MPIDHFPLFAHIYLAIFKLMFKTEHRCIHKCKIPSFERNTTIMYPYFVSSIFLLHSNYLLYIISCHFYTIYTTLIPGIALNLAVCKAYHATKLSVAILFTVWENYDTPIYRFIHLR